MKNRIYIFTQEQLCKICEGKRHGICDCCSWKQMPHLSQQKAIRVMGEAMRARGELCSFTFSTLAGYGLQALLEVKK